MRQFLQGYTFGAALTGLGLLLRAAFGQNVLRHDYEAVAHDVLWHVVRDNLPRIKSSNI